MRGKIIKKQATMSYDNHIAYMNYFHTNPTLREVVIALKMLELTDIKTLKKSKFNIIYVNLLDYGLINDKHSEDLNAVKRLKKWL